MRRPLLLTSLAFVLVACGGSSESAADAGGQPVEDAGSVADAGEADAGTGLAAACEGACRQTSLVAKLGSKQAAFDRVQFGYTSPAKSANGRWELHLEAHAGGDSACPTQASPTPDRTLILGAVPVPVDATPLTKADDKLAVTLFDYSGTLTTEPLVRGDPATFTPVAAKLCTECAANGGDTQADFVAFELDAVLPDGSVKGHGFAEHCGSLDDL